MRRARATAPRCARSAALGVEQSNTSVVIDDELIVKIYRRVEAGVNPELELLHFFATHGFENVPQAVGLVVVRGLAVQRRRSGWCRSSSPGAVDGWTLALQELRGRPGGVPRAARGGSAR